MPGVVRTSAPVGQTPIVRQTWPRDHLSVISGITADGKRYPMVRDHACSSADVVDVLKHLHRQIPGKLIVVWDGASIHDGKVRQLLADGAAAWLQLIRLPGYAHS